MNRVERALRLGALQRADDNLSRCTGCGAWRLERQPCWTPFCHHPTRLQVEQMQRSERRRALAR